MVVQTRVPAAATSPIANNDYVPGGFRLTGWRVLGILVLFFGTIGAVDLYMIRSALSTISGEVTEHPYESGLAYNSEIAAAQVQNALHWKVDVKTLRQPDGKLGVSVVALDEAGKPLDGLTFKAQFQAPADTKRDVSAELAGSGNGVYSGAANVAAGQWQVVLSAMRDGNRVFLSGSRVKID